MHQLLAFAFILQASAAMAAPNSFLKIHLPLGPGHSLSVRGNGGGLGWSAASARRLRETSQGFWEIGLELSFPTELKLLLDNKYWMDAKDNIKLHPGETVDLVEPNFLGAEAGRVKNHLINGREIFVYTPPWYRKGSGHRFNVVYLHDGGNLFGPNGWRAHLTEDQMLLQGRAEPSILVGIAPKPLARTHELTPYPGVTYTNEEQTEFEITGGGGDTFAQELVKGIKPAIDKAYDTYPDREHTTIGGSSLGGMSSLVIASQYPEVFGDVISMSSTWIWGDVQRNHDDSFFRKPGDPEADLLLEPQFSVAQSIRQQLARNAKAGKPMPRIFISVGENEWPVMQRGAARMAQELESIDYKIGTNLFLYRNPMGRHNENSWSWQLRIPRTVLTLKNSCQECLLPSPNDFLRTK